MASKKKITIITPSYNQGQFIEQTIDSVLSQNYASLEYIIVDGGSTDNTVEIIKKHEKHLAYWVSEPDKGQSDAINKGLKRATGDIVNWLNSDDYYEPDTLHKVSDAFADDNTNVLCGKSRLFKGDATVKHSRGTDIYDDNLAKTIGWARIDQPETFFRKSVIDQIGSVNPALHYVMDKEWWVRYLLAFGLSGIRKIDEVLVNFRLHESSKTISQSGGFEAETDALYFNLAQQMGFEKEAAAIQTVTDGLKENYPLTFQQPKVDKESVLAALHYYLLYKADLFYYRHQRKLSKLCLQSINKQLLKEEDRQLFNKLRFRNKVLPTSLVKLLRK